MRNNQSDRKSLPQMRVLVFTVSKNPRTPTPYWNQPNYDIITGFYSQKIYNFMNLFS